MWNESEWNEAAFNGGGESAATEPGPDAGVSFDISDEPGEE